MRTGVANLPLHFGKAPRWLFSRMTKLARQIAIIIVEEHGPEEFIRKMSDPFWFQSFGCVLGFDWHSSGITTTVCGAVKEGLKGLEKDIGIFVAGGKGGTSRKTPSEIEEFANRIPIKTDPQSLIYASKMSAKVDNTALQDGYQLYHHNFIFTKSGLWTVVQQGMNTDNRWARRYHWLSTDFNDFVCEPHSAICCDYKSIAFNMVAKESTKARSVAAEVSREKPVKVLKQIQSLRTLTMPAKHQIFFRDLRTESLGKVLLKTYEQQPSNFEELLGIYGVGPKTVRALSLIADLIYGARVSFKDPVKYSFAHGGKDGYPYPVDRVNYDTSINILRKAISAAKLGNSDKLDALKRLTKFESKGGHIHV
ncbi:MAG: DUF763 domain-containing protein [bacterium]